MKARRAAERAKWEHESDVRAARGVLHDMQMEAADEVERGDFRPIVMLAAQQNIQRARAALNALLSEAQS